MELKKAEKYFKCAENFFYALYFIQFAAAVTAYYLLSNNVITNLIFSAETIVFTVIITNSVSIILLRKIGKIFASKSDKIENLSVKLNRYGTYACIKIVIFTLANGVNLTALALTGEYIYAGMFVLIAALVFAHRPTIENFSKEFNITPAQSEEIKKMNL